jgi:hypothetical protein
MVTSTLLSGRTSNGEFVRGLQRVLRSGPARVAAVGQAVVVFAAAI